MDDDIKRVLKDLNCKANSILCTFHCAVPDSVFLPIALWWYTMEAQHKWNQSSGSRLKQNSEKDLAPIYPRALTLPLFILLLKSIL